MKKEYRQLTNLERHILDRLLSREFPGRDKLGQQISSGLVRIINEYKDNWGSLEFNISSNVKASVTSRIPVQGILNDSDGVPIQIFLHVVNGKVDELEIVKADNSPLKSPIDPKKIRVVTDQEVVRD